MVTENEVKNNEVKEGEVPPEGEIETPPDFGPHPPGAAVVADGGPHPEYRHARQVEARPVTHPLGEQPEGIIEDPITYPPDQLPPSLQEPGEGTETPPDEGTEAPPDQSSGEVKLSGEPVTASDKVKSMKLREPRCSNEPAR